jgi:hypothetical protein
MASAGRMKMSSTSPIARNMDRGNSLAGLRSEETWTAFISMPEYDRKLLTISTRLAMPAHCGSRCDASIGAADGLPWPRKTRPRMTSTAPGMSVPMIRPPLASPATDLVPWEETQTPVQKNTTITIAVHNPLDARSGLKT